MPEFEDWDLLAFDIADMLGDNEYPFDLTESDIRPEPRGVHCRLSRYREG